MEKSKREMILEAALNMVVENGFENSPTAKISKQAGVATGTLFNYFESKEKLINELYLDIKRDLVTTLRRNLDEAKTIRQKIECIWYNGVRWAVEKPEGYKFFGMFGSSSYISSKTREEGLEKFTFILDILNEGIEHEILKDTKVILLNEILFSMIFGIAKIFRIKPEELEIKEKRDEAFTLVWDAIKR